MWDMEWFNRQFNWNDHIFVIPDATQAILIHHARGRPVKLCSRDVLRPIPLKLRRNTRITGGAPIGFPAGRETDPHRRHMCAAIGAPPGQDFERRNAIYLLGKGGRSK